MIRVGFLDITLRDSTLIIQHRAVQYWDEIIYR